MIEKDESTLKKCQEANKIQRVEIKDHEEKLEKIQKIIKIQFRVSQIYLLKNKRWQRHIQKA